MINEMNEAEFGERVVGACQICDTPGATESIETDKFVYGSGKDEVVITVQVPVTWCAACGEGYTGEEAEIIRSEFVRRQLA